jgi:hypothetical protein
MLSRHFRLRLSLNRTRRLDPKLSYPHEKRRYRYQSLNRLRFLLYLHWLQRWYLIPTRLLGRTLTHSRL